MNSVEDTAQTMFSTQTAKNILQQASSIAVHKIMYGNSRNYSSKKTPAQSTDELIDRIKFTGQFTDIAYADSGKISEKVISQLCEKDEKLRNNVIDTYNNAVNDGLLERVWSKSEKDVVYKLTDKGKELINSENFKKQFEKNLRNTVYNEQHKNSAVVEFTGTKDDVNIFRYVDKLNVNSFNTNPVMKKLFETLEKYGFICVDENGSATATDKLKNYFAIQDKQGIKPKLNITKVTPDNMQNIADKLNKAQKTADTAKKAAEAAQKGTEAAARTTKTAVNAGTAAVTGGVSVAVTATVELSKKGLELINKVGKNLESSKLYK